MDKSAKLLVESALFQIMSARELESKRGDRPEAEVKEEFDVFIAEESRRLMDELAGMNVGELLLESLTHVAEKKRALESLKADKGI